MYRNAKYRNIGKSGIFGQYLIFFCIVSLSALMDRYLLFRCYCFKSFYHVSMSKTRIWVITFTTWPSFCNVLHLTSIAAQDESTIPCYFSDCQAACSLNLLTYPSQIQISAFPSITTRLGLSIFWRDASLASQSSSEHILMSPKNIQTPWDISSTFHYLPYHSWTGDTEIHDIQSSPNN